jgi:hypothetical protein
MREIEDLDQRLELARLGLSSTPGARTRVGRGLAARGAFSRDASSVAAPSHGVPKLLSAVLMGLGFAAGYALRDLQPSEVREAPVSVVEPSAPSPSSASAAPAAGAPLPERRAATPAPPELEPEPTRATTRKPLEKRPAAASERRPSARATGSTAADGASTTAGELALLRRAERALRGGDPALALILLDQLERAYPVTALGEERTAARILVDCARSGELAKPEAARFLEKHPSSVYSDRVLRACHLEAADAAESSADAFSDGH